MEEIGRPYHPDVVRRRGFENVGVNALPFQQALRAISGAQGADYFLKSITKTAPKGRSFVFREPFYLALVGNVVIRSILNK